MAIRTNKSGTNGKVAYPAVPLAPQVAAPRVTPAPAPAPVVPPPAAPAATIHAKFAAARREMAAALLERREEIDLVLTAALAGEHCLFEGPPGTAKSLLVDSFCAWLGGTNFTVLFNKFTTPEEVCGPVSVAGLKNDQYRRVTTGMLPEADTAFLDEIFKASSAILNTLLRILNEREFHNGGVTVQCPLQLAVAASNEWPDSKELGALFDRFLFRKKVKPVAGYAGLERLLFDPNLTPQFTTTLSIAELEQARQESAALPWSDAAKDALRRIIAALRSEGIQPGDRRLRKSVKAAQAYAWLAGGVDVQPEHLEVLAHVLWEDPVEQPEKTARIVGKIANPAAGECSELMLKAEQIVNTANPHDITGVTKAVDELRAVFTKLGTLKDTTGKVAQAKDYVHGLGEQLKAKMVSINML